MLAHDAALIQKQFVLNFMTSYMALFFTAFVYIPFGHILHPFLNFWRATAQTLTFSEKELPTREFHINPARISNQMFYFTVTAQIVNFATEVVVPYIKQQAFQKAKQLKSGSKVQEDHEEEAEFLERVRKECTLEEYDVSGDYREMVMQFGKLTLLRMRDAAVLTCVKDTSPCSRLLGHWRPAASLSTTGLSCDQTHSRSPSAAGVPSPGGPTRLDPG